MAVLCLILCKIVLFIYNPSVLLLLHIDEPAAPMTATIVSCNLTKPRNAGGLTVMT
jgi:hypothetical protein